MMNSKVSRRKFLAAAAAAVAGPCILPAWADRLAPSNRLGVATIGVGSRGTNHLDALRAIPGVEVLAVCDAFRSRAEGAKHRLGGTVTAYQDYREVLARPDIDAVTIASPENWHAIMAIEAMQAGKDVYCEKALSLTVAEGRAVCEVTRRYGRVFQAGTQQRSEGNFRFACELARNGYLGKLHTVTVGVPSGKRMLHMPVKPVPADLNYELWLGPAPFVPYRDTLCSYNWYFVTDYCAGWIQSWGVHHMDIALWGAPSLCASTLTVEGAAQYLPGGDADVAFGWQVKMTTPDGLVLKFHDDESSPVGHGCRFEGDKGWVHVVRGGIKAEPSSLLKTFIGPGEEHLYESKHHMENFIECIQTRRDPVAPVEACHAATTATLVADIATRAGRPLTWDWGKEKFTNDDTANRQLSRAMRSPWHL